MKIVKKILKWGLAIFIIWLIITVFSFKIAITDDMLDQEVVPVASEDPYDKLYNEEVGEPFTLREKIADAKKEIGNAWNEVYISKDEK